MRCIYSTCMLKNNRKKSKVAGTLWLGMAVFFLVFCSCPVKRYIRLHLYSQKSEAETTKGNHYSTYDVKDCTIADRHQQSEITILSFLQRPADDIHHGDVLFHLPSLLSFTNSVLAGKDIGAYIASISPEGNPMPIPRYLWVRHIQV